MAVCARDRTKLFILDRAVKKDKYARGSKLIV